MTLLKGKPNDVMNCVCTVNISSTTYPGTTEELIVSRIERQGYRTGQEVFVCFSPERVDPGNKAYNTRNTPKVIGGVTRNCTDLGVAFYSRFIDTIVPVSNPKVAEMSKLLENTFRSINIAFINEMTMLCDKLGISIWETIEAAKTKPFGFMPFYPGPGIGGHCIPLDPMYLSWKAREKNFYSRFIELAQEINKTMPMYIFQKIGIALNHHCKSIRNSKILILGMAYKPNVGDMRESPCIDVYNKLVQHGALVDYYDPHVPNFTDFQGNVKESISGEYSNFQLYDCVVLLTNHSIFDYSEIVKHSELIVDTRNGFKEWEADKIIRIGDAAINP